MTPARAAVPPSLILSAAIFIFQVIATYPVTWDGTGGGLVFGPGEELLYTEGVSRDLAEKLGDKLHEIGLFNGDGAHRSIIVSRVNDIFQVRIFLRHGVWKQRAFADFARDLRDRLEREVFAGAPVEIVLCDEFNRPQRWITRAPLEQME